MNGLLVIDKPPGITSRDAVNRVQTWLPPRTRVGHTGTLDPLATGALVLCVGGATRLAEYVQAMDKVYEASLVLGARSDTDDADGTITPAEGAAPVGEAGMRSALLHFVGEIEQRPPAYSAVMVRGRRAHELARKGADVETTPRTVNVYDIALRAYVWPELELEVHCGKGTYIRSLARDLGERLGCGAYVQTLRRSRVGPFLADDGIKLDAPPASVAGELLPPERAVANLLAVVIDAAAADRLRHGQVVPAPPGQTPPPDVEVAVFDAGRRLVGVGFHTADGQVRPRKMIS